MTILIDDWYPVYEAYGHRKLRRALWQLIADGRCRNDDELIHRYGLLRGELRPVYRGPVFQPRPWVRRGFYPQYRSYPAPAFLRPYRR
ncbi:MAG TPA: hypothetical protein PKC28_14660, partial [Bdellovibrionales bacterium]|nr:hypothetical protein [Bdellovibrionales bacterium]